MLNLSQYRERPDRLIDLLPWAAVVAPGIILNKDGSFQTTVAFRGPDLDSATPAELVSTAARLNNVFKRLGSGWAVYVEAQRVPASHYPASSWDEPVAYLIDEERRRLFQEEAHFESRYYLTLIYLPPTDSSAKLSSTFLEASHEGAINYHQILDAFTSESLRFVELLQSLLPEVRPLTDAEALTYLHGLISSKSHAIAMPEVPMYLDALLSDTSLLPGFEPQLGTRHLRAISVMGFPAKSQPGLLDNLNHLSIEYRWVSRFICLDKTDALAEIANYKRRWFAKRKGITTLLKEALTGAESVMADSDAVNKSLDADAALQELADDAVSYGYFTATVIVWGEDSRTASTRAQEVERVLNGLGFTSKVEDVNAVDAWLGTLPGNCRNNVRRPLLNSLNLSHLMPISAVWAGLEENTHLKAPPLLFAVTCGSTPFRMVTHVGDVGHTLVLGPTGSGKSVLLNLMEVQFLRYPEAQVYIFDKGGSARVLTAGIGGDFYDLGAERAELAFQPLANIDCDGDRRWAHEWIIEILTQEKITVTPSIKEEIWKALTSLTSARKDERTLFGLTLLIQNELLRQALLPYTLQGAHGEILDNAEDNLRYSRWQCFEMEVLMETPSVLVPVLSYLFHRLEQRLTGRPTLLVLDEAWIYLDHPAFAAKIREWLKVLRKANTTVIFATQSLADIDQSSIAATIKEACLTKIYLPNPNALNPDSTSFYQRFGLNQRQIEILSLATPKRDYYYTSPLGNRLFELGMGDLTLAYCASTSKDRQAETKEIQASGPSTPEFNREFLRRRHLNDAAEAIDSLFERRSAA